jgi:hypothetical protein
VATVASCSAGPTVDVARVDEGHAGNARVLRADGVRLLLLLLWAAG